MMKTFLRWIAGLLLACQFLVGTEISNITFFDHVTESDGHFKGEKKVDRYPPESSAFNAIFSFKDARKGDTVLCRWIAVKAKGIPEKYKIYEIKKTLPDGDGEMFISFERGYYPFPPGLYRLTILLNGKKVLSKEFDVVVDKNSVIGQCGTIYKIVLTPNALGEEGGERFPNSTLKLIALAMYRDAKPPQEYTVKWYAANVGKYHEVEVVKNSVKIDKAEETVSAEIRGEEAWLPGEYRVEFWCRGRKIAFRNFEMTKSEATAQSGKVSSCGTVSPKILLVTDAWVDKNGTIQYKGDGDRFPVDTHRLIVLAAYKDATPPVTYTIHWIAEKVGDVREEEFLKDKAERQVQKEGFLTPHIEISKNWPAGRYRIEIRCNGKKMGSKTFTMVPLREGTEGGTASGPLAAPAQESPPSQAEILRGKWVTGSGSKRLILEIPSSTVFIYGGKVYTCIIENGKITILDGNRRSEYPYRVDGDRLTLRYPGGKEVVFHRLGTAEQSVSSAGQNNAATPSVSPAASGIHGRFCCTPDQGNEWIRFLENGIFEYGTMGNLSGVLFRGRYRFVNGGILIDAGNGSQGVAAIIGKDKSGTPNAISFDGVRYAKDLCPRQ